MNTISDGQFASFAVITSIVVAVIAYEMSVLVVHVDDLTVPCQHSTDIVDGECSCAGTPFSGTYCEENRCVNGNVGRGGSIH